MIPIHKVECTVSLLAIKILFLSLLSFDSKKKSIELVPLLLTSFKVLKLVLFLFSNNKSGMNHSF